MGGYGGYGRLWRVYGPEHLYSYHGEEATLLLQVLLPPSPAGGVDAHEHTHAGLGTYPSVERASASTAAKQVAAAPITTVFTRRKCGAWVRARMSRGGLSLEPPTSTPNPVPPPPCTAHHARRHISHTLATH
jgi:hypothetical protein